jgi:putative membrane protein
MMWGDHGWGWGWGFGPVSMLLFWVLVVVAVVALGKYISGRSGDMLGGKSALDILKERYARGEIGKDEFEQKRRDLEG